MNIKQAKEEIKRSVQAYLSKDESGEYYIPSVRQRPILLIGPPGVGKTQIMEQIARECQIGLVAYTMTHHTRQSAVGLPFIQEKNFEGKTYSITEYTMSEIISSVYQNMEETGVKEGLLFLDEINCVSETLAPTMLRFLQCKAFGNQEIPNGWLIVAAGNPPEYNKSVREFDMATLDRIRCIPIEADYKVWREYAVLQKVHPALLSYLELRPNNFYRIEADIEGMQYVTARGWEDFSYLLYRYEKMGFSLSWEMVYEYLHHKEAAQDVTAYLELYQKYQDHYGIQDILKGRVRPEIYARIYEAEFDERFSVVHLLLDGLRIYFHQVFLEQYVTDVFFAFLKSYRNDGEEANPKEDYKRKVAEWEASLEEKKKKNFLKKEELRQNERALALLKKGTPTDDAAAKEDVFQGAKALFDAQRQALEKAEEETKTALEFAFDFMERAFQTGEEIVVFVTELTVDPEAASFLSQYECERYLKYNEQLLIGSRRRELLSELKR